MRQSETRKYSVDKVKKCAFTGFVMSIIRLSNECGKLDTSLRFVARSLLARRARISLLHFCLSTTSLPWSEPRLAYNLLLLTLKSRDFQPVLCWTLGHRTVTLTLKLQKKLGLECKGQSSSIALASTASLAKVSGVVNCNISAFKDRTALN